LFKNDIEDEADFCEAYKSQVLNNGEEEKESPLVSILIILFLLAMIIALSIFGYKYIMSSNTITSESQILVKTISDDELKVTSEVVESLKTINNKDNDIKKTVVKSLNELPKSENLDINGLADKIKINLSESEPESDSLKESKKIEEPTIYLHNSIESKYIEDLAKLTEEIDKERE